MAFTASGHWLHRFRANITDMGTHFGDCLSTSSLDGFSLRFIDWAKQHGHNPATGVDAFIGCQTDSDLKCAALSLGFPCQTDIRAKLRFALMASTQRDDIAVQFPAVHVFATRDNETYRYTLMLMANDGYVEWTARVWRNSEFQGVLIGRGRSPRSQQATQLARMAVEGELNSPTPHYSRS